MLRHLRIIPKSMIAHYYYYRLVIGIMRDSIYQLNNLCIGILYVAYVKISILFIAVI